LAWRQALGFAPGRSYLPTAATVSVQDGNTPKHMHLNANTAAVSRDRAPRKDRAAIATALD
jgi:hypothetical protein